MANKRLPACGPPKEDCEEEVEEQVVVQAKMLVNQPLKDSAMKKAWKTKKENVKAISQEISNQPGRNVTAKEITSSVPIGGMTKILMNS